MIIINKQRLLGRNNIYIRGAGGRRVSNGYLAGSIDALNKDAEITPTSVRTAAAAATASHFPGQQVKKWAGEDKVGTLPGRVSTTNMI